jgi:glycosyltransferase involved in cell wall biosynthesis
MRYLFLTAFRNESSILRTFLDEFTAMVRQAGIADDAVLYMVDDLSIDRSVEILDAYPLRPDGVPLHVIRTPTNLGNQGALFYGIARIEVAPDDVLVTFDCDGEDDVREIPSVLEAGKREPGKLVLIERGRRRESMRFKLFFGVYKALFRFLTNGQVIPNNFMLIPGHLVPAIQRSPLVGVHFAYGILKLRAPYTAETRDRRARYGGKTSQNLFMLVSHGLVGLMVFYEVVLAKLFVLSFAVMGAAAAMVAAGILLPPYLPSAERVLLWLAIALMIAASAGFGLLVASGLALAFKLNVYFLTEVAAERRGARKPLSGAATAAAGAARDGRSGTGSS